MTEFERAMELVRIMANKAAYSGKNSVTVEINIFLGILSRAEAWTKQEKERENNEQYHD